MTNFHVTDEGRVMPCRASVEVCKYGDRDDNRHFTNEEEANSYSSVFLSQRYEMFNTQNRNVSQLPNRIKNYDRPGNLSLGLDNDPCLSINRFGRMNPDNLPEEFFSDFRKECAVSVGANA